MLDEKLTSLATALRRDHSSILVASRASSLEDLVLVQDSELSHDEEENHFLAFAATVQQGLDGGTEDSSWPTRTIL
jgi:hypothetical protein